MDGSIIQNVRQAFPALALGFMAVAAAVVEARPAEAMTVSQWSDEHRHIAPESGSPHPGKWRTSRAPYLREIQDCCGIDHPSREVSVAGSAQSGKSEVLINAAFHCIDTDPRSMLILAPSIDKAQLYNKEKWEPNVQVTEPIALKTFAQTSRSSEASTSLFKRFHGGFLKIVSAATAKQLQSSTIGFVILEEPTDYPLDADGRGDPIVQARHRMDAFGPDGKLIAASTTGEKGSCRITAMVEAGDHRKPYVPCPHCGKLHTLRIDAMDMYGRDDPTLGFACPSCSCIIEEHHLPDMLDGVVWVPTFVSEDAEANPTPPRIIDPEDIARWCSPDSHMRLFGTWGGRNTEGRHPSFQFWQAYSPFASWVRIWRDYREAKESPEKLKTFYQQVLAEPYEPAHDRPKDELIYETMRSAEVKKLAQVTRGSIPPWASMLIGSADVQGDRIEWAAYAFGPRGLMARIDRGVIDIDPDDDQAWIELARVSRYVYDGPHLKPVGFDRFGCDTGGHHTRQAYLACQRYRIVALKGKPNDRGDAAPLERGSKVKVKDIDGRTIGRVPLWLVGTHRLKSRVYRGLNQAVLSADTRRLEVGAIYLEPDLTDADAKQITAEYLTEDIVRGSLVRKWERPRHLANEQLDLAVYALALAIGRGLDRLDAAGWAKFAAERARDPALEGAGPLEALMLGEEPVNVSAAIDEAVEEEDARQGEAVNASERRGRTFRPDLLKGLGDVNKRKGGA